VAVDESHRHIRPGVHRLDEKVVAAFRISIVRYWSATSLRSLGISAASSVVGRLSPRSALAWLTQFLGLGRSDPEITGDLVDPPAPLQHFIYGSTPQLL
jgi:hypothetical protein